MSFLHIFVLSNQKKKSTFVKIFFAFDCCKYLCMQNEKGTYF